MNNEQKFTLKEFSTEEGKKVTAAIEELVQDLHGKLVAVPYVDVDGTLKAQIHVYKKVELVPKEVESIPSPYLDEQTTDTKTEESSESDSEELA